MIVITSAAYVGSEFQAEFGKLPPSMLPLGNRRLFEHQVKVLREHFGDEVIHLSLPEKFDIPRKDALALQRNGVNQIFVPEGLSLSESLLYVLNFIGQYDDNLKILHGDTFLGSFPFGNDVVGVARTHDDYNWEVEKFENTEELVWCGYFSFSDIKSLVRQLVSSRGNFVEAVRHYGKGIPLNFVEIKEWYDLGHVNTYFKSRAIVTTERSFNELKIAKGCVVKNGYPPQKIKAEAQWFKELPVSLKRYAPQLIDFGENLNGVPYYILEYLCFSPLNEIFVHGRNPSFFWEKIFHYCNDFLNSCFEQKSIDIENKSKELHSDIRGLISDKTLSRLNQFSIEKNIDLGMPTYLNGQCCPSISIIAQHCIDLAFSSPPLIGVVHGDFCLSNIIYDSRAQNIKVIDPRGINYMGNFCLYGDIKYDLAKLSHSILGLYDFILAGAYRISFNKPLNFEFEIQIDDRIKDIQEVFIKQKFVNDLCAFDVIPLMVLLFLSMLPLHEDHPNRQVALLANAIRLYNEYILQYQ